MRTAIQNIEITSRLQRVQFGYILSMQKHVRHVNVSSFRGQKMGVGFNLALLSFVVSFRGALARKRNIRQVSWLPPPLLEQTILHLRKDKCILVGEGSQERQSVCYFYDIIIFPVGFSFVLSPFQYYNALQKAQMRYRLLAKFSFFLTFGFIQR